MALPVVVPNHTGLMAFCSPENSYLVPVNHKKKDKIGFHVIEPGDFASEMRRVVKGMSSASCSGVSYVFQSPKYFSSDHAILDASGSVSRAQARGLRARKVRPHKS